jgi:hypothetical protein
VFSKQNKPNSLGLCALTKLKAIACRTSVASARALFERESPNSPVGFANISRILNGLKSKERKSGAPSTSTNDEVTILLSATGHLLRENNLKNNNDLRSGSKSATFGKDGACQIQSPKSVSSKKLSGVALGSKVASESLDKEPILQTEARKLGTGINDKFTPFEMRSKSKVDLVSMQYLTLLILFLAMIYNRVLISFHTYLRPHPLDQSYLAEAVSLVSIRPLLSATLPFLSKTSYSPTRYILSTQST